MHVVVRKNDHRVPGEQSVVVMVNEIIGRLVGGVLDMSVFNFVLGLNFIFLPIQLCYVKAEEIKV